jgi:hypothetical protein
MLHLFCIGLAASLHGDTFPISHTSSWWHLRSPGPVGSLWSGVVERCEAAGVSGPHLVEDILLADGRTQELVSVGSLSVTNTIRLSKWYRVTNQIAPYVWSYSDLGSSVTSTTSLPVTRALLEEIDVALLRCIPYYADPTNPPPLSSFPTGDYPIEPLGNAYLPQLMLDAGVGLVTNAVTNAAGVVVDADWYWTRQMLSESRVRLAQAVYGAVTNDWQLSFPSSLPTPSWPSPSRPWAFFDALAPTSLSVVVQGFALVETNQSFAAASETVSLSSTPAALTSVWHSVTNLQFSAPAATGSVVTIAWTNDLAVYSSNLWAHTLQAAALNERAAIISSLIRVDLGAGSVSNLARHVGNSSDLDWATLQAEVEADFSSTTLGSHAREFVWARAQAATLGRTNYTARATAALSRYSVSGLSTNFPGDLELWLHDWHEGMVSPTEWIHYHDPYGTPAVSSAWFRASVITLSATHHYHDFGSTNYPFAFTAQPLIGQYTSRGYDINLARWYFAPLFTHPR